MSARVAVFRIAPMCRMLRTITYVLFVIPALLLAAALFVNSAMLGPAFLVLGIYAWVWLGFRPSSFIVTSTSLEVIWPMKRRTLDRASISDVTIINAAALKSMVGWGARVGAGGLWGGFGWLWTSRRGVVQMYISRVDQFVWIERNPERAWLITPETPEMFVQALKV